MRAHTQADTPVHVPVRRVVGDPCVRPTIHQCALGPTACKCKSADLALPLPLPARCPDALHFKRDCHISEPLAVIVS